jgi:thioredoxin 1
MTKTTSSSFKKDVIDSTNSVVVNFGADWCQPCKALKPTLEILSQSYNNVDFTFVDIDESDNLATEYNIKSVPTLAFFKNGEMLGRMTGNASKAKIEEFLHTYI